MSFLRRKKLIRTLILGCVILVGVIAYLTWTSNKAPYRPGEVTDGLVDTLARNVPPDHPKVSFTDVSLQAGLDVPHFSATRTNRLPEDMGSGVALGDFDNDGWVDIFFANEAGSLDEKENGWPNSSANCRLYRNLGDGTFEDVTESAGVGLKDLAMGASFLDVDADGFLDLFVTAYERCYVYKNQRNGTFVDESSARGVADFKGFWTGLAVGDYDVDGDVDIYVCGYVRFIEEESAVDKVIQQYGMEIPSLLNPSAFDPERNLLFRNRGDGTFEEVAGDFGVDNPSGRSLAAVFADVSGDGLPDLYVANDVSDNAFFLNKGEGKFEDQTHQALIGDYRGAMGIAVGDYDSDLDFDLFITHWVAQENALYTNISNDFEEEGVTPDVLFIDEADRLGLGQVALTMVGWATAFFDYNNDGERDLFVVNGGTIPMSEDRTKMRRMRSQLFWNAGPDRGFFEVGAVSGDFFRNEYVGRGGALFDYDLDGDEDLLVVCHGEGLRLLRNDGGSQQHSIRVRLRQPDKNRFALGSLVKISHDSHRSIVQTNTQGSYLSQHAVGEVSFGLGSSKVVDQLEIRWPDGTLESYGPVSADSLVEWEKGSEPKISILPGKRDEVVKGPESVSDRREFFNVLEEASLARIRGDLDGAITSYRRALEQWPFHEDSLYYMGNCLADLGQREAALRAFHDLVGAHPESNRGWMQIGRLYLPGYGKVDLDAAERAFSRSHHINGEESGPVVQLGLVALLREEFDKADRHFAEAALLNHRSIEAPYFRGLIAWRRGNPELADTFLQKAHEIGSQSGAGESKSNEGDTLEGKALLASQQEQMTSPLHRWKTLSDRVIDVDIEYGSHGEPDRSERR